MRFLLPLAALVAVFLIEFLIHHFPELPSRVSYLPDAIVGAVAALVIARLVVTRRIGAIPPRYLLVFFGFMYVVISGTLLNQVSPDVTVAGIRSYFKYVPLFLIPFAYTYSQRDLNVLLWVIVLLALIQIPVAIHQRFVEYSWLMTGDVVTGTFAVGASGTLSILLVCCALVVASYALSGRLSNVWAAFLSVLLLLPTAINETKITPILLTIGAVGVLFAKRHALAMRHVVAAGIAILLLAGAFGVLYDIIYGKTEGVSYAKAMSSEQAYGYYRAETRTVRPNAEARVLAARAKQLALGSKAVARFDSLLLPFESFFPKYAVHLLVGLGVGNATSTFGSRANYLYIKEELGGTATTLTQLIWECGVLGAIFYLAFFAMVTKDALVLSRREPWSSFAAGWVGVCLVLFVTLFYQSIFVTPVLPMLFSFFSGLVISKRASSFNDALLAEKTSRARSLNATMNRT